MNKSELKAKLDKPVEFLHGELSQIRTGRVTPALLDPITVNAYGSKMTVREVGTISVLDAQTLQIAPWDKSLIDNLVSAISNSDLNLNPSVSNDAVVVPVPSLTEERRREFTKIVSQKVEETKHAIRNIRQEAMKDIDTQFNNKEFGEDEKFSFKDDVEEVVKEYVNKIEEMGEQKKSDIMSV